MKLAFHTHEVRLDFLNLCIEPSFITKLSGRVARPSSPVRQDGERRTTFLDEYAFCHVPFSRLGSFFFVLTSDFQFF